jgi:parvulin-like peptidyl-prolyl isomerase
MPTFRSQIGDGPAIGLQAPMRIGPPAQPQTPPESEIKQTTAMTSRGTVRISIRAWVNGQPIFDEEIRQIAGPALRSIMNLPDSQRDVEMTKMMNAVIDRIVDQELMYQDAVKKLQKAAPHQLDKLQEFVDFEFNKTLQKMRAAGAKERDIRDLEPIARRMMKRELVATEYARTLIKGSAERVALDEIREYYDEHKNEFQSVDRVEWQDIFIRTSDRLPTIDAAKRFAEDLINRCRTPDDFIQLMVYNNGVSKTGEGLGNLRGQIQPRELEDTLFKLREGEIGPVIPIGTGVHLIRCTKREYAGQKPLDVEVQKTIRKKLENERAEREYRRLVRELRARATIRMEKE